ncbi:ankyrin repeat domain-containing protein [Photobacterium damselae]|uniref:ankyrin repeat domain-containing protein n=1 Tax=Photobacterium damselae TaxID=38293 RepID=UPI00083AE9B6|nr:ankyrin repeat domain-containing protein [Photobacterium damselae]ODA26178.1 ankryin [Photobacterium damselae subsp. damselae]TLS70434.1 ankyrin repeat domain-containing protein [Photobacterium damselae subsp. damselae]
MAIFPTFESVLLQIAKALGANSQMTSKSKSKFKYVEMTMDNLSNTWISILGDIADALGLDEKAKMDFISNVKNDYLMHKRVELGVYSSKASQRKIVWHYLARVIIPALARHSVFWQIESKMDLGMPAGRFWYLPAVDSTIEPKQLLLPVPQVLSWLIDLIQETHESIASNLEKDLKIHDGHGTVLKNLYNWKNAKSTPEVSSINNLFPDEVNIQFCGCFEPDEKSSQFEQALGFIEKKGLSYDDLQHEIDINCEDLKRILKSECSVAEQQDFVRRLKVRYQAPSSKVIRMRLLIARAIQEGYQQLVKFLTPKVDKLSFDLNENKTLQLVELYNYVYNLTFDAHIQKGFLGQHAENKYFEEQLPSFFRYDLLRLFTSDNEHDIPWSTLDRINSIFSRSGEEDILDNIFPTTEHESEKMHKIVKEEGDYLNDFFFRRDMLIDKLKKNKSPFKQLQSIDDFEVVYGARIIHMNQYSNPNIGDMIVERLKSLESNPTETMKRILFELEIHLILNKLGSKTEEKVSALLDEAKHCDDFEFSKANILRYEALHYIAQNKLKEAEKNLNLAIDECKKKYSFGTFRGWLARDAFALVIANQKLIPNNHEKYFRDMYYWGVLKRETNIYDVSRDLHEYFWKTLYKCYPNYQPQFSDCSNDIEKFSRDFAECIKNEHSIELVLKKHKALKKKQLKYPQADSIILLMMKMNYELLRKLNYNKQMVPTDIAKEISDVCNRMIQGIRKVIELWPEIVNVSDFKEQTPLMFAANTKDYQTVKTLLKANADPNKQDFRGRTALHAAAASRCWKSASFLLEYGCDAAIAGPEGSTALHTAIRMGEIAIVELLIEKRPELLKIKDSKGILPEQLARKIATDPFAYELLNQFLKSEDRSVVSLDTYKKVLEFF